MAAHAHAALNNDAQRKSSVQQRAIVHERIWVAAQLLEGAVGPCGVEGGGVRGEKKVESCREEAQLLSAQQATRARAHRGARTHDDRRGDEREDGADDDGRSVQACIRGGAGRWAEWKVLSTSMERAQCEIPGSAGASQRTSVHLQLQRRDGSGRGHGEVPHAKR